ncbi:hypothetical protein ACET7Y_19775 [Aeromonas veronii]|uniref:hypothetical protein n=1 Tax=Aeromonas veronii TaxID=654 RepID=UPI0030064BD2
MKYLAGKKILFICPRFFGYEREIELELINLGAKVDYFNERPFESSVAKVLNRLNFKAAIKKAIEYHYSNIIQKSASVNYDYLFVVAPETMTTDFIKDIKVNNKKIKTVLYLWDSIKNKKNAFDLIEHFDKVLTFDKTDSLINSKVGFLPLFYIDAYAQKSNQSRDIYQLAFIGTAHSGRYNLVKKIIDNLGVKKHKNYLFYFSPSKLLFCLKKSLTNELNGMSFKDISFNSMTSKEIISVLADTNVVIDIEHPRQNGLTMRTIEMLGMQKKLITTNKNVAEYDFYNKNNILIVDRNNPQVDPEFIHSKYQHVDKVILEKYRLSTWLINLFS